MKSRGKEWFSAITPGRGANKLPPVTPPPVFRALAWTLTRKQDFKQPWSSWRLLELDLRSGLNGEPTKSSLLEGTRLLSGQSHFDSGHSLAFRENCPYFERDLSHRLLFFPEFIMTIGSGNNLIRRLRPWSRMRWNSLLTWLKGDRCKMYGEVPDFHPVFSYLRFRWEVNFSVPVW